MTGPHTRGLFSALDYVRDHETMDGLSPAARHLLTLLAVFTGRHGTSHPSLEELAGLMGYGRRYVQRLRAELVAAGRIEVRYGGGSGQANVYLLARGTNPELLSTTVAPRPPFDRKTVAETVAETVAPRPPQEQEQGERVTSTDATRYAPPPWVVENVSFLDWKRRQRELDAS